MKNRKTVVVAFLLVAAMLLGVGYAALTDTLTIGVTASASYGDYTDEFDEDIYFSAVSAITHKAVDATTTTISSGATAIIDETNDSTKDTGAITVNAGTLKNVGESISVTYTIESDSDLDATVSLGTITNSEHFAVTTDWTSAKTLKAGDAITVTVTVTLAKTPATDVTDEQISLTFTATTPTN